MSFDGLYNLLLCTLVHLKQIRSNAVLSIFIFSKVITNQANYRYFLVNFGTNNKIKTQFYEEEFR